MENEIHTFYVALQSTGVLGISFDPKKPMDKSLSVVSVNTDAGHMPGYLASYDDKLYSISRSGYSDSTGESGGLFAFRKLSMTELSRKRALPLFSHASSGGNGGVHCEVSPDGRILAAANITASTVSIYPLLEDGIIGSTKQVIVYPRDASDGKEAHPHQTAFDPTGRFLFVPMRTQDRIDIYSVKTTSHMEKCQSIEIPGPAGARHVAFGRYSPSKTFMYLVSEKENAVRVFTVKYVDSGIVVELKQTISTLGLSLPPTPDEHREYASAIAVSSDNRFVYASKREVTSTKNDSIAIYSIEESAGDGNHLKFICFQDVHGKHPRMFSLSPDRQNKWVVVANQFTQNVVIFDRDTVTGLFGDIRGMLDLSLENKENEAGNKDITMSELLKGRSQGPMCISWAEMPARKQGRL